MKNSDVSACIQHMFLLFLHASTVILRRMFKVHVAQARIDKIHVIAVATSSSRPFRNFNRNILSTLQIIVWNEMWSANGVKWYNPK